MHNGSIIPINRTLLNCRFIFQPEKCQAQDSSCGCPERILGCVAASRTAPGWYLCAPLPSPETACGTPTLSLAPRPPPSRVRLSPTKAPPASPALIPAPWLRGGWAGVWEQPPNSFPPKHTPPVWRREELGGGGTKAGVWQRALRFNGFSALGSVQPTLTAETPEAAAGSLESLESPEGLRGAEAEGDPAPTDPPRLDG